VLKMLIFKSKQQSPTYNTLVTALLSLWYLHFFANSSKPQKESLRVKVKFYHRLAVCETMKLICFGLIHFLLKFFWFCES
jgi:hypothetical protein